MKDEYDTLEEAANLADERQWWVYHNNLLLTAEYLNDLAQVLELLEKPWHWTEEFVHAVEFDAADQERDFNEYFASLLGIQPVPRLRDRDNTTDESDEPIPFIVPDEDVFRGER